MFSVSDVAVEQSLGSAAAVAAELDPAAQSELFQIDSGPDSNERLCKQSAADSTAPRFVIDADAALKVKYSELAR